MASELTKEKRVSTIKSLKEVITLIAALTFANAISKLLTESEHLRIIENISYIEWINFLLLLLGIIRFYHGNLRFLDDNYIITSSKGGVDSEKRKNEIWFDFFVVLLIS